MKDLRAIAAIGEGINNSSRAVLKDEAVSIVVQTIADAAILYENYAAIGAREVFPKAFLRSGDHRKTIWGQGQ